MQAFTFSEENGDASDSTFFLRSHEYQKQYRSFKRWKETKMRKNFCGPEYSVTPPFTSYIYGGTGRKDLQYKVPRFFVLSLSPC